MVEKEKETKICFGLDNLKHKYEKLRQKFNLPAWKEMNEDFEIEKFQDKETDLLIRDIRRAMLEKSLSYLKFIEMFLNPASAPMFIFSVVKNVDSDTKKIMNELYLELGKMEISAIGLDNEYDEKKEAEFIKKLHNKWQDIKFRFKKIVEVLNSNLEKTGEKNNKGYLG